jgi:hypothetical protein
MYQYNKHLHFYSCEWLWRYTHRPQCIALPGAYTAVKTTLLVTWPTVHLIDWRPVIFMILYELDIADIVYCVFLHICPAPYVLRLVINELRVVNSCVEGREVKCFNDIAWGEGARLHVPYQIIFGRNSKGTLLGQRIFTRSLYMYT